MGKNFDFSCTFENPLYASFFCWMVESVTDYQPPEHIYSAFATGLAGYEVFGIVDLHEDTSSLRNKTWFFELFVRRII